MSEADERPGAMHDLRELLANNRAWAEGTARQNPEYFGRLASQHAPQHLWIGCSDARVPANEVVGLAPGELFVHRNVGNVVIARDLNLLAVLQLAVDWLGVPHVIVCGHYRCYGVECAWRGQATGRARKWLKRVDAVASKHAKVLDACDSEEALLRRLCELNVLEQAANVCRVDVVQKAWKRGLDLSVHGWIYAIENGLIRDLGFRASTPGEIEDSYEGALARVAEEAPPGAPSAPSAFS